MSEVDERGCRQRRSSAASGVDKSRSEQVRVGVVDDAACSSAEDDAAKADSLCPSWACGLGVFTRSHGKEVCAKCDVGRLGVGGVLD